VPLGTANPDHPNISATLWRTVYDEDAKRLYLESALRPAIFWVKLDEVNLDSGAEAMKLETRGAKTIASEVSSEFKPEEPVWLAKDSVVGKGGSTSWLCLKKRSQRNKSKHSTRRLRSTKFELFPQILSCTNNFTNGQ